MLEAHETYSLEVLVVYHNFCMSKPVVSHFEQMVMIHLTKKN